MASSILADTKKALGIMPDYTEFDSVIIMHTNSAFGQLHQLGLGPINGYMIEGASDTWGAFFSDDARLNPVKSYVFLYVKQLFDPPTTSFQITAYEKVMAQMEWRLNVVRENAMLTEVMIGDGSFPDGGVLSGGDPFTDPSGEVILDGGSP